MTKKAISNFVRNEGAQLKAEKTVLQPTSRRHLLATLQGAGADQETTSNQLPSSRRTSLRNRQSAASAIIFAGL